MVTELTAQDYVQDLLKYIQGHYPTAAGLEIPLDRSLVEAGILDSYAIVEIVAFIEDHYGFSIPDLDITRDNFGSVVKMSQYILRRLSQ